MMSRLRRSLLLLAFLLAAVANNSMAQLPGWRFVRPFLIDNSTNSENLTNYQVRTIFNHQRLVLAGQSRPDGADIRFTQICEGPVLDHWIEKGLNTTTCVAWIRVPVIAPRSKSIIFMHYGNLTAPNIADPNRVFELYDDFSSLDPTKWQRTSGSSAAGGYLLPVTENPNWGGGNYLYSVKDFTYLANRGIVEAETEAARGGGNIIFFVDNPTTPNHYLLQHDIRPPASDYDMGRRAAGVGGSVGGQEVQFNPDEPTLQTVEIQSNTFFRRISNSLIRPTVGTQEPVSVNDGWNWQYIGFSTFNTPANSNFKVNWMRVRKFTPVEPTMGEREQPIEVLAFNPRSLVDFSFLCSDDTTMLISMQNQGRDPWDITDMRLAKNLNFSMAPQAPYQLTPLGTKSFQIRFTSALPGTFTDTLVLTFGNACPRTVKYLVRGVKNKVAFAFSGLRKDTLDFGTICPDDTKDTFLFADNGSSVPTSIRSSVEPRFKVTDDSVTKVFAVNEQRRIPIKFRGAQIDTLIVSKLRLISECGDTTTVYLRALSQRPFGFAAYDTTVCVGGGGVRIGALASRGRPPYRYLWAPANGLTDLSNPLPMVNPSGTTTYIRTITDANNCVSYDTVRVIIGTVLKPKITIAAGSSTCKGDSVTLSAGTYSTYLWSTGERTPSIRVNTNGLYDVLVSNGSGCNGVDSIIVRFTPRPKPTIAGVTALCPGSTTTYTTPAIAGRSYTWSVIGAGSVVAGVNTPNGVIRWNAVGSWKVGLRVKVDSSGCIADTTYDVEVTDTLKPAALAVGPSDICEGDTAILTTDSYNVYRWSNGDTTQTIRVTKAGDYSVFVIDGASGCSGVSAAIAITYRPKPQPAISGLRDACLTETRYSVPSVAGDSYLWGISGGGSIISGQGTPDVVVRWTAGGDWMLTLRQTGSNGCVADTEYNVRVDTSFRPTIVALGDTVICEGDTLVLDAGGGFDTYNWSNGATTRTIEVFSAGTYSVTVAGSGCSGTSLPIGVAIRPRPVPTITVNGTTLESSPAVSYQWYIDGVRVQLGVGRQLQISTVGTYTVEVTDTNGCAGISPPFLTGGANIVSLPAVSGAPGDTVDVALVIEKIGNDPLTVAKEFTTAISFNRSLLIPISITGATWTASATADSSTLELVGSRKNVTNDTLVTMRFQVMLGDADITVMNISNFQWLDAVANVTTTNGSFTLVGICRAGATRLLRSGGSFGLRTVSPNPVDATATIEFDVIEEGPTRLILRNMLGQPVVTIVDEPLAPGRYVAHLKSHGIAAGLYYCILTSATQSDMTAIEVVR